MRRCCAKRKSTSLSPTGWLTDGAGSSAAVQTARKRRSRSLRFSVAPASYSPSRRRSLAAPGWPGPRDAVERRVVGEFEDLGLVQEALQPQVAYRRKVEDRAGRSGDADAVALR